MSKKLSLEKKINSDQLEKIQNINDFTPTHVGVGRRGKFAFFSGEFPQVRKTRRKWRFVKIPENACYFQLPEFCWNVSGYYYGDVVFYDAERKEIWRYPLSTIEHPLLAD